MTKLTKPVARLTAATILDKGKHRNIIVTVDNHIINLRLKNTQQEVNVHIANLFQSEMLKAARLQANI